MTSRPPHGAGGIDARGSGKEKTPRTTQPTTPAAAARGKKKPKTFVCRWRRRRWRVPSIKAAGVVTLRMPPLETLHGTVVGIQVGREHVGAVSFGHKIE